MAAIQVLTRADGAFDPTAAFAQARAQLGAGRGEKDSATVSLLTGMGATVPPVLGTALRQERTAVNPIGMLLPVGRRASQVAGGVSLGDLAQATGGRAGIARNAEGAAQLAMRAISETTGEVFALMAYVDHETLAVGSKSDAFTVSTHDGVISAHWYFDPEDKARLGFQLVTPAGAVGMLSSSSDLNAGRLRRRHCRGPPRSMGSKRSSEAPCPSPRHRCWPPSRMPKPAPCC